jgi:cytochrome c biogenesis protein CcdA
VLQLIGVAVSVGLADALNPSTIGPALYLAADERGLRRVLLFTAGVFAVYLAGGVLLVFGPGNAIISLIPHPGTTLRYWLEFAAGVVLIVGAVITWWRRVSLARRPLPRPRQGRGSGLVLGASITAVELPTAFPYFGLIAAIVSSRVNDFQQVVLLVIFNAVFVLPLVAIAVTLAIRGSRAVRMLTHARRLMERHWPEALAGVLGVIGVVVALLGVTGLINRNKTLHPLRNMPNSVAAHATTAIQIQTWAKSLSPPAPSDVARRKADTAYMPSGNTVDQRRVA